MLMASKTSTPVKTPSPPAPSRSAALLKNVGAMAGRSKILGALGLNSPGGLLTNAAYMAAEQAAQDQEKFMKMNPELEGQHYPYGMKRGGKVKGGSASRRADGMAHKGKTKGKMVKMAFGGSVGGSYRKGADGIASKGKTRGKIVKMMMGGVCK
jgi:hypothetical protein